MIITCPASPYETISRVISRLTLLDACWHLDGSDGLAGRGSCEGNRAEPVHPGEGDRVVMSRKFPQHTPNGGSSAQWLTDWLGWVSPSCQRGVARRGAKEATVSRLKAYTRGRVITTFLAGALTALAAGDLARAQSQGAPTASPTSNPTSAQTNTSGLSPKVQAAGQLVQARVHLKEGNFEAAETLARSAAAARVLWMPREDTPAKVLQDIQRAKQNPQLLLKGSRAALARKDFVAAEKYARLAERQAGLFSFPIWGDSPAAALRDIEAARRRSVTQSPTTKSPSEQKVATPSEVKPAAVTSQPAKGSQTAQTPSPTAANSTIQQTSAKETTKVTPPSPTRSPATTPTASDSAAARRFLKEARAALQAGKIDTARDLLNRARACHGSFSWWEDNPERLEADLRRLEAGSKSATTTPSVPSAPATAQTNTIRTKEQARELLVQGRKYLAEGQLDQAAAAAQKSRTALHVSWGLFEDSPDRLLLDIDKARARRDRQEADRLLAEGRKLYEKGDYEGAARLAYRAQKLQVSYSIWDFGDRPSRLLADIQTAQARSRKPNLPPSNLLARKDKEATTPATGKPAAEATAVANQLPKPPVPVMPPERLRAQQLVAEAQRYQREGKLIEAKKSAQAAADLRVPFGPEEVSPGFVLQQVAVEARQKVESLIQQSQQLLNETKGDLTSRYQAAEARLQEARSLAMAFGHDLQPVENQLSQLRTRLGTTGTALASRQSRPGSSIVQTAHQSSPTATVEPNILLDNARAELRKGEVVLARRLAEQALLSAPSGPIHEAAQSLLRSVDAEEFKQKGLAANRTFDAALACYRRKEYVQASTLLSSIDIRLLDAERLARLREISQTPEMSAASTSAKTSTNPVTAATPARSGSNLPPLPASSSTLLAGNPGRALPADGLGGLVSGPPGSARVSDQAVSPAPAPDIMDAHRARQKILFEKLRQDSLEVQREASEKFRAGQHALALEMLQDHLDRLADEKLEPGQLSVLRRPVESRLNHFRLLKAQKDLVAGNSSRYDDGKQRVEASRKAQELKQKNVDKLMKDFNTLFKEGKYQEAEALALRALELDPDNGVASTAVFMARRQRDVTTFRKIKQGRDKMTLDALNDAEDEGPAEAIKGMAIDKERLQRASKRKALDPITLGRTTEKTKQIQRSLSTPVNISFENTPLSQALSELRDLHGINIVPDTQALQEEAINLDSPISIKLENVSLKSALNLMLRSVRLTWVIKDEVLLVTTETHARDRLVTTSYLVADLVIPVENFGDMRNPMAATQLGNQAPSTPVQAGALTPTPAVGINGMINGQPVGTPTGSMLNNPNGSSGSMAINGTGSSRHNPTNTTEEQLIKLVTSTIEPRSWAEMGGPGTIEYYPLTLSLVVNQTPDIQEQIQELLEALRRLQDQEVAVEVRFISVSEDFFERIGVNFSMNILTDKNTRRFEPELLTNIFNPDPTRFINAFTPSRMLAGITPAGSLTPTLDIPISGNSFFQTVPSFGNYVPGLSMGLAFLSQIQVFLFLEAVQGDVRSNVMQAPKLTLFNGQSATLQVFDTQSFVTGVAVAQLPGGQFAMVPQAQIVPTGGVFLFIQAVITADRRSVRLTIQPNLTNIQPGPVSAFPLVVPIFTSFDGNQSGQPIVFTQFIQQPAISTINVQTTVAVPDGGTVLMGGLKRLSEARSEYGPPILSKIPWVNRLFKNVGYGRETDSLLIMVTPRIIIQEEEQEYQTGVVTEGGQIRN